MNILLIMPEALRPMNLHCCGYAKQTSPFIDKLAREGVLFRNAIAQTAHTYPGVASIYTGLYPHTHELEAEESYNRIKEISWSYLKSRREFKNWETPLDILKRKDYRIIGKYGGSISQPLGCTTDIHDEGGILKAIEKYKDNEFLIMDMSYRTHIAYQAEPPYDTMFLPEGYKVTDNFKKYEQMVKETGHGYILNPKLVSKKYQKAKTATAWKVFTLSKEDRPSIIARYDGALRMLDMEIETYIKKLEELGILDDTLIIITSDHGEEILEHGSLGHASCSMAGTLYEENVRIPLIMRYPKALPQGKIIDTQIGQVDIMPTIFDMLGLSMPEGTEGHSLMPLIKGEKVDFNEETYLETLKCGWQTLPDDGRMLWAVRTPEWKLIFNYDYKNEEDKGSYELYNLKNDPGEKHNLIDKEPEIAKTFENKLNKKIKDRLASLNRR
ncbi:MAG: sulfatase-like hydrolase/transferase [bacterium]|nr:sulfatase-like hydrolase/transferase [bacterium]